MICVICVRRIGGHRQLIPRGNKLTAVLQHEEIKNDYKSDKRFNECVLIIKSNLNEIFPDRGNIYIALNIEVDKINLIEVTNQIFKNVNFDSPNFMDGLNLIFEFRQCLRH